METSLAELVRSELVFRTGTPPNARYTFKHVLVQQAAYDTLLRSRRQDLHARVAKAIMERLPDEAEHRSHLLLHHATLAGNHELAALACINAGERSLQVFAQEEAYRLAERGLKHLDGLPDSEQKARFHVKLLVLKVHAAYKHGDEVPELVNRLQETADTARALGLHNEAVSALHARAWLQLWSNDARGASQTALNAEEASRKADEISRCHQIANTGRCLLEVEQQISRALLLIDEAEVAARTLEIDFVELEWARAHAARSPGLTLTSTPKQPSMVVSVSLPILRATKPIPHGNARGLLDPGGAAPEHGSGRAERANTKRSKEAIPLLVSPQ
jgi:predicted ATPase